MAPKLLATCTRCVFKNFKKFERCSERLLGKVGPVFIALAVVLIGGCAFAYFDVVYRLRYINNPATSTTQLVIGALWSAYLVTMFSFHYYKAITTKPGTPQEPPSPPSSATSPWFFRLPTGLCVGPLRRLLPNQDHSTTTLQRKKAKLVKDIAQAQEKARSSTSSSSLSGDKNGGSGTDGLGSGTKLRKHQHERVCRKCPLLANGLPPEKPERTHHCSVCRTCILKYDHHCPWISSCVGLHNERYFLLFLVYFTLACTTVVVQGWEALMRCLEFGNTWEFYTPRVGVLLLCVLAAVMAFAVGIMAASQLWLIATNETAVESHDNKWYRKVSSHRGRTFQNPYHLGWKRNFALFFNLESSSPSSLRERGHHWITVLLPVAIPPSSDGWQWEKRRDWELYKMEFEDELTDEEEFSDDDD
ncbi:zf-DHHC-domain-containing protein [Meredithblackwellia eburnea MCA 4105]